MDHGGAHPFVNNPPGGPGRRVGGGGHGEAGLISRLTLAKVLRVLMVFMLVMYIFLLLREIAAASMGASSAAFGGNEVQLGPGPQSGHAPGLSPARIAVLERKVDDLLRRVSDLQSSRAGASSPAAAAPAPAQEQTVVLRILVGALAGATGGAGPT
jgi:hypothetical protein